MAKLKGQRWNEAARETRAELVTLFPACFMPRGAVKKPLALGIYKAIRERAPDIASDRLSAAIRDYTTGPKYLGSLSVCAARFDLDGNEVGTVTESEAEHATAILDALQAFWAASAERARCLAALREVSKRRPRPTAPVEELAEAAE